MDPRQARSLNIDVSKIQPHITILEYSESVSPQFYGSKGSSRHVVRVSSHRRPARLSSVPGGTHPPSDCIVTQPMGPGDGDV